MADSTQLNLIRARFQSLLFPPQRRTAVPAKLHGVKWSHVSDTIPQDGGLHGFSRFAGDASYLTQTEVASTMIDQAKQAGLNIEQAATAIAIARFESGFNPDAANPQSSASGIGQFIRSTGEEYGLDDSNRFDIVANAEAMIQHLKRFCFPRISKFVADNPDFDSAAYAYGLWHDGQNAQLTNSSPGVKLGAKNVTPVVTQVRQALEGIY